MGLYRSFAFAALLALADTALADQPVCEVHGTSFRLVLPTGSHIPLAPADFLKLAERAECAAPPQPYDCKINLSRFDLSERYGNHCRLIENSPPSFDYYSLTVGGPESEAFATGTCYKVECQYGGEGGGRRMVYDNAGYCAPNPSEVALNKFAMLRQLGFCK